MSYGPMTSWTSETPGTLESASKTRFPVERCSRAGACARRRIE
jgi:hypothetical protein